jgi:suppressor for copper-sensitivity B
MIDRKNVQKVNVTLLGRVAGVALAIACFGFASMRAQAETASPWSGLPEARARLIAGQAAIGDGGPVQVAVEFRLAEGWKTYWRNPGESGAPPQFDWSRSVNARIGALRWPAPKRFSAFGFDSFGYASHLVLPVDVEAENRADRVALRLDLNFLVCERICVPVDAKLALELPAGPASPTGHAPAIAEALSREPVSGPGAPFRFLDVRLAGPPDKEVLRVEVEADADFDMPDLMIDAPMPFSLGRPAIRLDSGRRAVLTLPVYAGPGKKSLDGRELLLTLVDGRRAAAAEVIAKRN